MIPRSMPARQHCFTFAYGSGYITGHVYDSNILLHITISSKRIHSNLHHEVANSINFYVTASSFFAWQHSLFHVGFRPCPAIEWPACSACSGTRPSLTKSVLGAPGTDPSGKLGEPQGDTRSTPCRQKGRVAYPRPGQGGVRTTRE
jgi:hypothetical protein